MEPSTRSQSDATPKPTSVRAATGLSLVAAVVAVIVALGLLAIDAIPGALGVEAHGLVSAVPLALVALAYMLHQPNRRPTFGQAVKALVLSAAFLLWAAAQLRPGLPPAVNDAAIALFVLDLALVVTGDLIRPPRDL